VFSGEQGLKAGSQKGYRIQHTFIPQPYRTAGHDQQNAGKRKRVAQYTKPAYQIQSKKISHTDV
jgi:hypothetical protein